MGLRDGGSVDGGSVAAWDYGIVGSILKYYCVITYCVLSGYVFAVRCVFPVLQ